jgi:glycosyltransferase involved in cell wall biosynthesis
VKILHLIGTLDPAYGGPVEGLQQLSKAITALGHTVEHVTLDPPSADWLAHWPFKHHALGPSFARFRFNLKLKGWLKKNGPSFDVVVVHGIWQWHGLIAWFVAREVKLGYVVFVHGALDPWFRIGHPFKHLKKTIYWRIFERRILRDARAVVFTSEEEKELANNSFKPYEAASRVIGYGLNSPDDSQDHTREFYSSFPTAQQYRLVLFMGRLHRKKGLDLLVEAFCSLARANPKIVLAIAGPDEEDMKPKLQSIIDFHQLQHRVMWLGMLRGNVKRGALQAAEVFCLPSHSENFGIAVAEALSESCPVLISNKVNIWREVASARAGLVEADTLEGTKSLLNLWLTLDSEERLSMRTNASKCFNEHFNVTRTVAKYVDVLEEASKFIPSPEQISKKLGRVS